MAHALFAAGAPSTVKQGLGTALTQGLAQARQASQNVYGQAMQDYATQQQMDVQAAQTEAKRLAGEIMGDIDLGSSDQLSVMQQAFNKAKTIADPTIRTAVLNELVPWFQNTMDISRQAAETAKTIVERDAALVTQYDDSKQLAHSTLSFTLEKEASNLGFNNLSELTDEQEEELLNNVLTNIEKGGETMRKLLPTEQVKASFKHALGSAADKQTQQKEHITRELAQTALENLRLAKETADFALDDFSTEFREWYRVNKGTNIADISQKDLQAAYEEFEQIEMTKRSLENTKELQIALRLEKRKIFIENNMERHAKAEESAKGAEQLIVLIDNALKANEILSHNDSFANASTELQTELRKARSRLFSGLGVKLSEEEKQALDSADRFDAAVYELLFQKMGDLGGARGITETEAGWLRSTLPQLSMNATLRNTILNDLKRSAKQRIKEFKEINGWVQGNQDKLSTEIYVYKKDDDKEFIWEKNNELQGVNEEEREWESSKEY